MRLINDQRRVKYQRLEENSPAEQHNASQDADEQIAVAQEEL